MQSASFLPDVTGFAVRCSSRLPLGQSQANSSHHTVPQDSIIITSQTDPMASLDAWANGANWYEGQQRAQVAERIRQVFQQQDTLLDLFGLAITSLPPALTHLTHLQRLIIDGTAITQLDDDLLPDSLQQLTIGNAPVTQMPSRWPSHLEELDLRGNTSLNQLDIASLSTLRHLDISGSRISQLSPELLANLEFLNARNSRVMQLPSLSHTTLRHLDISNTSMTVLPLLPDSLEYLDASNTIIEVLPERWPFALTHLDVSGNYLITQLTEPLPASLQVLKISGTQIETLPVDTPNGLKIEHELS